MENESTSHCPVCGEPLPEHTAQGLCPRCLLREAATGSAPEAAAPIAHGMPAPPSLEDLAAAFPNWEIQEMLGRGGMGAVYKVRQPMLDRIVAIKILPVELAQSPGFAERFAQEARLLAKLGHPNIVAIHDFGQAGPFFYVLMEYVDGVNLRQAMEAGRFSAGQALLIVRAMCDALEYAHGQGVVHRDIKPENILLDAGGRVKLVDFGIGKLASALTPGAPYLTATGDGLGTPHYMAPEQVERARDVDHRADIYSLGVVCYELLTGELPLGRFPTPSERVPVDPAIDPVVMKALERQREKRHQDAAQMRQEAERAEAPPLPAAVPRASVAAPAPTSGNRNPWLFWAIGSTVAALLALASLAVVVVISKKEIYNESIRLNRLRSAASQRQFRANQDARVVEERIRTGVLATFDPEAREIRRAKEDADNEMERLQASRSDFARPSPMWWLFSIIAVIGLPAGCVCGWLALNVVRQQQTGRGTGAAMFAALLIPVIALALLIDGLVRGMIDPVRGKNIEQVITSARSAVMLLWMLAAVWLIATVLRWVRRQTPVMATLNRTFVLTTGGLAGLFLIVILLNKL